MTKETVGKIIAGFADKQPETLSPVDMAQAGENDLTEKLIGTIEDGKKIYPHNFFIVIEQKWEKILSTDGRPFGRRYVFHRWTCPTPYTDQSAFLYNKKDDCLEYLWSVPDKETCNYLAVHALEVHQSERDLLKFVLEYRDGTLLKLAMNLNGEL